MSDNETQDMELIEDGISNAGSIFRRGDHVIRPAGTHSPAVHAFLRHLEEQGFAAAPRVVSLEAGASRETLSFIHGTVPKPPYDEWVKSDQTLHRLGALQRAFHDAARSYLPPASSVWSRSLADPAASASDTVNHNDMGPGNIVFQDGAPAGIIDFDFTAPGRNIWDIARMVRVWAPLDYPQSAKTYGLGGLDPVRRLRVFTDGYGLPKTERLALGDILEQCNDISVGYVRSQYEAGKPSFVKLWTDYNLGYLYDKRREWMELHRADMRNVLA